MGVSPPGVGAVPVRSSGRLSVFTTRVGSVPGEALGADVLVIWAGCRGLVLGGASWLVGESSEVTGISLVAARSGDIGVALICRTALWTQTTLVPLKGHRTASLQNAGIQARLGPAPYVPRVSFPLERQVNLKYQCLSKPLKAQ